MSATSGKPASSTSNAPWTVRALLQWIQGHLESKSIDSPRLCAEILVSHVLECDRIALYMKPDVVPSDTERARLRDLVARAARHEPLQYLVGAWQFRGRSFEVNRSTLIPRPATETLVGTAVQWYRDAMFGQPLRMADIGTGTGIIAVSVVSEVQALLRKSVMNASDVDAALPSMTCIATDVVAEAVELAKRNVARHGLETEIDVRQGSLFEPLARGENAIAERSLDLICANLPYVSDKEFGELEPNVKEYEPASALRAGADGLDLIRPLVEEAPRWLRPGGALLIEIAASQGKSAGDLFERWDDVRVIADFEKSDRVVMARVRAHG